MNFNKFTIKSQEAVQNAQEIARVTATSQLNGASPRRVGAGCTRHRHSHFAEARRERDYVKIKINEIVEKLPKIQGSTQQ